MPRGRILLKSISESKKLSLLKTDGARLLFSWLIPHVDVNGCFSGSADVVNGKIFSRLGKTNKKVENYLQDLEKNRLIIRYKSDSDVFLQIPDFIEKQPYLNRERESKPSIPLPPLMSNSGVTHEQLMSNSGVTLVQIKSKSKSKSKSKIEEECSDLINRSEPTSSAQLHKSITFSFKNGQFEGITDKIKNDWKEAFPAVDIELFIKKMAQWVIANPKKRRRYYYRSFVNWLNQEQERGGTRDYKILSSGVDTWVEKSMQEKKQKEEKKDG